MRPLAKTVTLLLHKLDEGDASVINELFEQVYNELRRLAHEQLKGERKGHTLNATALVHEAYLKLVDSRQVNWQNKAHFFAVAARSMRQILIDYARQRKAQKRGGNKPLVTFNEENILREARAGEMLLLDETLSELEKTDPRMGSVVEMKFFAGLTFEEIAEVLGVSPRTIRRDWRFARAWLTRKLK
jgi:RNA polymerase sigma factor (TIGR02999 family)